MVVGQPGASGRNATNAARESSDASGCVQTPPHSTVDFRVRENAHKALPATVYVKVNLTKSLMTIIVKTTKQNTNVGR